MADEQGKKKNPLGATGIAVANNVKRLRDEQGLAYTELAARLERIGRTIPTLGLRKIESYERRVDADDLAALAVALEVSPITLLMPAGVAADDIITTWESEMKAAYLWEWLRAEWPFPRQQSRIEFWAKALPPWKLEELELHWDLSARVLYGSDDEERAIQSESETVIRDRMTQEIESDWNKAMGLIGRDDATAEHLLGDIFRKLRIADGDSQ